MIPVPGYELERRLHGRVHAAVRRSDGAAVIVKVCARAASGGPSAAEHEFAVIREIGSNGIAHAYALERCGDHDALILEQLPGVTLRGLAKPLSVRSFVPLAIQLVRTLGELHASGWIHQALRPEHVIVEIGSGEAKLIGLDEARRSGEPDPLRVRPLAGLPYRAPEQTGRLDRGADFASDVYALGALFYRMLAGEPPFIALDPLRLIAAHLSEPPVPVHERNAEVPLPLARLIERMLAKRPEDRPGTAELLRDLLHSALPSGAAAAAAPLADGEPPRLLRFARSAGREREESALRQLFERVCEGRGPAFACISGPAGSGKTTLVRSLVPHVAARGGYLAMGQSEPLHRELPYSSFASLLGVLVEQLLAEGERRAEEWRERLETALGGVASGLLELVPELSVLLGPCAPAPRLSVDAMRERLFLAIERVISAFARPETPLVLALDDLQACDLGTRPLLERVLGSTASAHLLVIATCRSEDGSRDPAALPLLEALRRRGVYCESHELGPLAPAECKALLAAALGCDVRRVEGLTAQLGLEQGSVPLLLEQQLALLVDLRRIWFDADHGWTWIGASARGAPPEDVPHALRSVLTARIERCSEDTREWLKLASCIGRGFAASALFELVGGDPLEVRRGVQRMQAAGLVEADRVGLRFSHASVRDATLSLCSAAEQRRFHYEAGKILLCGAPGARLRSVDHLNQAPELLGVEERFQVVELNAAAARRALEAGALGSADAYLRFARAFAHEGDWASRHPLLLDLYLQSAECALLDGDGAAAQRYLDTVSQRALSALDRARIAAAQVVLAARLQGPQSALGAALAGLASFGIRWPRRPQRPRVELERWRARRAAARPSRASAPAGGPASLLLLAALAEAARPAAPALFALASARAARELLGRGVPGLLPAPEGEQGGALQGRVALQSAAARLLAAYAELCGASRPGSAEALHAAAGARAAAEQGSLGGSAHWAELAAQIASSWHDAPAEVAARLAAVAVRAQDAGDPAAAWAALFARAALLWMSGAELRAVAAAFGDAERGAGGQASRAELAAEARGWMEQLAGAGAQRSARAAAADADAAPGDPGRTPLQILQAAVRFALGDHRRAFAEAEALRGVLSDALLGSPLWTELWLVHGVSAAVLHGQAQGELRRRYRRRVCEQRRRFAALAPVSRARFADAAQLLEAEWQRLRGRSERARSLYAAAYELAARAGIAHHAAWILERHADLALAMDHPHEAASLLHRALAEYRRCGARAAQRQIWTRHGALLGAESRAPGMPAGESLPEAPIAQSALRELIDLAGVGDRQQLATRLVAIAAGLVPGERAALWLEQDGALRCIAERAVEPRAADPGGPRSIIEHVQRTQRVLCLEDAASEGPFVDDPWVRARGRGAVLCLPLARGTRLLGVLYLEPSDPLQANGPAGARVESLCALAALWLERQRSLDAYSEANRRLEADAEQRSERLREALQGSESASRAIGEFLAGMSHEIRTPMNVVLGMLHSLHGSALESGQLECLSAAQVAAQNLMRLIDSLLDYSSLESGSVKLEHQTFSLRSAIESLAETLAPEAERRRLGFAVFIDRRTVDAVIGDRGRFQQVLTELLRNAVKFTREGRIDLHVEPRALTPAAMRLRVEVSDTGAGIPGNRIYRVFRGFSRDTPRSGEASSGFGIGLAITKRLVEVMGGVVGVNSEPGHGSTFWAEVDLPIDASAAASAPGLPGQTVLVLARHHRDGEALCEQIHALGGVGQSLHHPAEGLARIEAGPDPAACALLVRFPLENPSWEPELRALRQVASIPLIALTSGAGGASSAAALEWGYDAVLNWPPRLEALREAVSGTRRGAPKRSPAPAPRPSLPPVRPEHRILLVEDYPLNQKLAVNLLKKAGYVCDVVADGQKALDAYRDGEYDLILMDCQMPVMDGYEATRAIRRLENESGGHIPIIAVTANAVAGDRERCLQCGMDDYLSKPIVVALLYEALDRYLAKARIAT